VLAQPNRQSIKKEEKLVKVKPEEKIALPTVKTS